MVGNDWRKNGQKQAFYFLLLWTIIVAQFGCFLNWNACTSKFTGGVSLTRDVDFFGIGMGDFRFGVAGIGRWTRHLQNLRKINFRRKSFFFFFFVVILKNLDAFEQTHHWSRYLGGVDFRRRWILETFRLFGGAGGGSLPCCLLKKFLRKKFFF